MNYSQKYVFAGTLCTLLLGVGALIVNADTAAQSVFARNLKLGDTGSDVLALQQILNSDPRTRIAVNGPGSQGNETQYFGELTKLAVIKFQELHFDEVLAKSGLRSGTGFVGVATRGVLSTTKGQSSVSAVTEKPIAPSQTPQSQSSNTRLSKPVLYRALNYQVAPKGTLTLVGQGFDSQNNTVRIGGVSVPNVPSSDRATLTLVLPDSVQSGVQTVTVENSSGKTDGGVVVQILVTNNPSNPPEIHSAGPQFEKLSSGSLTIRGANFTNTGNSLYTSLGSIENIDSADGKTLTVSLRNFPHSPALLSAGMTGYDFELWIVVQNSNGASEKPFSVRIQL